MFGVPYVDDNPAWGGRRVRGRTTPWSGSALTREKGDAGVGPRTGGPPHQGRYRSTFRSLSAFAITETELKVMAALAIIGLRSKPKMG